MWVGIPPSLSLSLSVSVVCSFVRSFSQITSPLFLSLFLSLSLCKVHTREREISSFLLTSARIKQIKLHIPVYMQCTYRSIKQFDKSERKKEHVLRQREGIQTFKKLLDRKKQSWLKKKEGGKYNSRSGEGILTFRISFL